MQRHTRFPRSVTIIAGSCLLFLLFFACLSIQSTVRARRESGAAVERRVLEINARSVAAATQMLDRMQSTGLAFFSILDVYAHQGEVPPAAAGDTAEAFFLQNPDIAAFNLNGYTFINNRFFAEYSLVPEEFFPFFSARDVFSIELVYGELMQGDTIENVSPDFGVPMAYYSFWDGAGRGVGLLFSMNSLVESFRDGPYTSMLLSYTGTAIVHGNPAYLLNPPSFDGAGLVTRLLNSEGNAPPVFSSLSSAWKDGGTRFLAAYSALPSSPLLVATMLDLADVLPGAAREAIVLAIASLSVLLLLWVIYRILFAAPPAERADVAVATQGSLTAGVQDAPSQSAAPDRGAPSSRRHGTDRSAESAGQVKKAALLFCRIYSFSSLYEKRMPREALSAVSDFYAMLSAPVEEAEGRVDYIRGDSMLAVWDAPEPALNALHCIGAALLLRSALIPFNQKRVAEKKARIRVGCGIHVGEVLTGPISLANFRDSPVFGDAVSQATLTESFSMILGADILITENAWKLARDAVVFEEMPPILVKGKRKPQQLYAAINRADATEGPASLSQVRRLCGIPRPR